MLLIPDTFLVFWDRVFNPSPADSLMLHYKEKGGNDEQQSDGDLVIAKGRMSTKNVSILSRFDFLLFSPSSY